MGSIQKGCVIAKNEFGTLERVDGSRTCIGSTTLPDGKVITKRFRGNITEQDKVIARWEKWQSRSNDEDAEPEEDIFMEEPEKDQVKVEKTEKPVYKVCKCPFSGEECGPACPMYSPTQLACSIFLGGIGLYNLSVNIARLNANESLELIAMAVSDLKGTDIPQKVPAPTEKDLVDRFLEGKSFMAFVNLNSKKVHADFKKFCAERGFEECPVREKDLSERIFAEYKELERKPVHGGVLFMPRG